MTDLLPLSAVALRGIDPSVELGTPPRLEWLPLAALRIDPRYQRTSANGRKVIVTILEQFRWAKFQPVTVAPVEDGLYAVIDGQHRAIAAASHPLIEQVPCWIVEAEATRDQARAFVGINRDRLRMSPLQIYKAQLAGGDPDALRIQSLLDGAGLALALGGGATRDRLPPRTLQAVNTLQKLLSKFSDRPLATGLRILSDAWQEVGGQITGQHVEAIVMLAAELGDRLDCARMTRVIGDKTGDEWLEAARIWRRSYGGTTGSAMTSAWKHAYDKGLSADRRIGPSAGGR